MPDNSPVLTPEMVAFLVKEDGIPIDQVLAKMTPAEKKAFISSEFANDREILPVSGDPLMPPGLAGKMGGSLPKISMPSIPDVVKKAGPQLGGAVGAMAGKMVGHPWAGWNAGHKITEFLMKKGGSAPPMKDPKNLLRGADSFSSRAERVSHGVNELPPNVIKGGPKTMGRAPRDGGIVEGSGQPKVTRPGDGSNLEKVGRNEFTEVEKRANMFGGASVEGQAVKPNARQPLSFKDEADKLVEEIMKGKTGGSLPNNAPRGSVAGKKKVQLRKPKK